MDFDLTEDEEMLKALAQRFVAEHYDLERRSQFLKQPAGFSRENWAILGELGLIASGIDAQDGGLGVGATGLATLFEAFGHGFVVEPLIENVILAGRLFAAVAPQPAKDEWLEALLSGRKRIALAHREKAARRNHNWVSTRVEHGPGGSVLIGAKFIVPAGAGADVYIVSARFSGGPGDDSGVKLCLVRPGDPGMAVKPWGLIDGTAAVSLQFDHTPAEILGGSLSEISHAQQFAFLMRSAEALGGMERLFATTLEYLKTRKQFGKPLGSFQALQHRMVAQYAAIEQSRALLNRALMVDADDCQRWNKAVDGARAFIANASVELGHEMIQMHGGMGLTDELIVGHGHKRLLMLSRWPDGPEEALDRYARADATAWPVNHEADHRTCIGSA